jgi:hypothetical protein
MVAGAIVRNISAEATTPTGNIFAEAMRGPWGPFGFKSAQWLPVSNSGH